jgi:ATP-dependent helicase Lhr and Lhr-like helicase
VSVFGRLHPRLQDAIVSRLGFTALRPVQELAGEALLAGSNAVVLAPTAGGKTEASMFPTLSMLLDTPTDGVGALYIAPIKALLNNQAERLGQYTEMVGLRRQVWHGDTPAPEKRRFVREPAELLMTTPESLEVMLVSQSVPAPRLFADLRIVVIDEVHAMAGTDRGAHLMSVLERLRRLSRHDLQRVGLSATVGNPAAILAWLQGTSTRTSCVVDPPKKPARRDLLVIHREDPRELAADAARMAKGNKSLFFCQSRATTEAVAGHMRSEGIDVFVHHSAVSREERQAAEENFARGADACIVCTSTLELGIDVGDLDRVLQHQAPDTVSSFMQRMGRTGRRGDRPANTTFFCESSDAVLQAIALVELAKSGWVEDVPVLDRCWPVLVHQIFAMSLATEGVFPEELWQHASQVPDFRGITRAEFDGLLAHMLAQQWLVEASARLVLGPKAERRFGRKNFMELYAVFTSPQSYAVLAGAASVGTLQQDFVDRLVEGISTFLLGGRAWSVVHIDHKDREIRVTPAPRGKKPTWGGHTPQFLGFDLCQRIRGVLASDEPYAYLHETAQSVLRERRGSFEGLAGAGTRRVLHIVEDEVQWWTFAGGRVNTTLKYALEAITPWKVIPDNYVVRLRGDGDRVRELDEAMARISEPAFWEDDDVWSRIAGSLPDYRLSKFQDVLPDAAAREMLAGFLLDVPRARAVAI